MERGLPLALARQVAEAMSVHDALGAHARDELGLTALRMLFWGSLAMGLTALVGKLSGAMI